MKHKHADLIKQWADGAEIEYWSSSQNQWCMAQPPSWAENVKYRIKPQQGIKEKYLGFDGHSSFITDYYEKVKHLNNVIKITFADGEITGVEIVK